MMKKISDNEFSELGYKDLPKIIANLADDQLVQISFWDSDYNNNASESGIFSVGEIRLELSSPESIKRERIAHISVINNLEEGFTTSFKILTAEEMAEFYQDIKDQKEREEMEAAGIYLMGSNPDCIIETAKKILEFRTKNK